MYQIGQGYVYKNKFSLSLAHLSQKKLFCMDSSPHYFLCACMLTTLHKIKKGAKNPLECLKNENMK